MKGGNSAAHKGTEEMKKGQIVKCVTTSRHYLTEGKKYVVSGGKGDLVKPRGCGEFTIEGENSFTVVDDEGDMIFQSRMCGFHGEFEVVS